MQRYFYTGDEFAHAVRKVQDFNLYRTKGDAAVREDVDQQSVDRQRDDGVVSTGSQVLSEDSDREVVVSRLETDDHKENDGNDHGNNVVDGTGDQQSIPVNGFVIDNNIPEGNIIDMIGNNNHGGDGNDGVMNTDIAGIGILENGGGGGGGGIFETVDHGTGGIETETVSVAE